MKRTGRIVITTLLIVMLTVAAGAQNAQAPAPAPTQSMPPTAARPIDRSDLRHQIYVMEGALMRAVSFGAQRLTREIKSVFPEMMAFSGEPQARGVYLDNYGVYFDVGVPVLHQSAIWSVRTMLGQDEKGVSDSLTVLKQKVKEARTPGEREAIEYAIGIIELQRGFNSAAAPQLPMLRAGGPGALVAETGEQPATQATPQGPTFDRKYLQDPNALNRAYTESVQRALVDAMIDWSGPMVIGAEEFLTVGARDNMQRDSLAPLDPYEEVVTILLRVKGADMAAYRAGQIDREEARRRVQIREF